MMKALFYFALATAGLLGQTAPIRVDTAVAMKQLVRRVEPAWTQALLDANPGAVMVADLTVSADGTVESVAILNGPEALRPALTAAVRQWTFTPFRSAGRPTRAIVLVDFQIRNPREERFAKAADEFRAAIDVCFERVQSAPQAAVTACETAVTISERLPVQRRVERSHAAGGLAAALVGSGRPSEALVQVERALSLRNAPKEAADGETATLLVLAARAHIALGARAKADALLTEAAATLRRAITANPPLASIFKGQLDRVLQEHARLKSGGSD